MDALTRIALVGTAKQAGELPVESPADGLCAGLNEIDLESRLLLQAGALASYRRVGQLPLRNLEPAGSVPDEEMRQGSDKLNELLHEIFTLQNRELIIDFLQAMSERNVAIPNDLLPTALNQDEKEIRDLLLPILGIRGKWLAMLNPDWSWGITGVSADLDPLSVESKAIWEEGKLKERLEILTRVRRKDSATGRNWLQETFSKEKAEVRTRLLDVMRTGLSLEDEDFLEACLNDRSSVVTQVAAGLLAQLPESQLSVRMRERGQQFLRGETKGILQKRLALSCHPPETLEKSWEKDGIPKNPPTGKGERAFWVENVLASVSPDFWSQHFQATPADLIAGLQGDQFADAVLDGWTSAVIRYGANHTQLSEWIAALWEYWCEVLKKSKGQDRATRMQSLTLLMPLVPTKTGEQEILLIANGKHPSISGDYLMTFLERLSTPWSESFSSEILRLTDSNLRESGQERLYVWIGVLQRAGLALAENSLPVALETFRTTEPVYGRYEQQVETFCEILRLRHSFYQELNSINPR